MDTIEEEGTTTVAVASSPSLLKPIPEQVEVLANGNGRPKLSRLSSLSANGVAAKGRLTASMKSKSTFKSFTLSASTPSVDGAIDRRAQFARERSYSVPQNLVPKSADELWDEVQANWAEYSHKGKWLTNILYKKGIPANRRGNFWTKLSKIIPNTELLQCSQEEYDGPDHYCLYRRLLEIPHTAHEQQIRADITRTFPSEKSIYAPEFQESLFNVLKAFSLYDPDVGYCQGLSFVAALLLMNIPEEQAFFMLIRLLKGHNLRSFYTEDMRGVRMRMFQMNKITQLLFPEMYKHMEDLGVSVAVVTTPWFMTAFGYQLPLDVALRVTDILLYEGIPALFRIALAILVLCEKEILELGVDGVMDYFRSDLRAKFMDPQKLMTTAYAVNVSLSQLEKLEFEFLQSELVAEQITSEFDNKSEEDLFEREKTNRFTSVLIDSHELKEKLVKKNNEYDALVLQFENYQKKVEADKIALIERLGKVLDRMNDCEAENEYLTEKLAATEEELKQSRKKCGELTECNSILAEEIYKMKKLRSSAEVKRP